MLIFFIPTEFSINSDGLWFPLGLWVIYHVNVLLTDFAFFALVSRVSSETCDEYESILYGF